MKRNKGFTLIELLVVIAIIGILSAIVLASLNSARNKAKVASATASLSSMRAAAEMLFTSSGTYPSDLCTVGFATLKTAVENQLGTGSLTCNLNTAGTANTQWAASASSTSLGMTAFCVDSTGYAGGPKTATAGVCS